MYKLGRITLKVQRAPLELVRAEGHLFSACLDLGESGVILVRANELIIECMSILRLKAMLSSNRPKGILHCLDAFTFINEVFLVLLGGQNEDGLPERDRLAMFI